MSKIHQNNKMHMKNTIFNIAGKISPHTSQHSHFCERNKGSNTSLSTSLQWNKSSVLNPRSKARQRQESSSSNMWTNILVSKQGSSPKTQSEHIPSHSTRKQILPFSTYLWLSPTSSKTTIHLHTSLNQTSFKTPIRTPQKREVDANAQ